MFSFALDQVRIAVVLHIFYLDLWPEIAEALSKLPRDTTIFITTTENQLSDVRECVYLDFPNANVYGYPNRGRDIGPLLELMKVHQLEDFDLVLKIHSKKSLNAKLGSKDLGTTWRRNLLDQLIPSWGIDNIVSFFERQPNVGMAGPSQFLSPLGSSMYDQRTNNWFLQLLLKIGNPPKPDLELFFAGTMFWARGQVFGALRLLGLEQNDIESETGQTDGTLAHALERIFPLLVKSIGLQTKAFPLWDYRTWMKERVPLSSHVSLIRDYLAEHCNDSKILLIVIDPNRESELVAFTLRSLQVASAWGVNVHTLVLCDRSELLNALKSNKSKWFFVVDSGTELTVSGLLMVVQKIVQNPNARAVYADEMTIFPDGKIEANLRPDFNFDLLLSCPSVMCRHWFFNAYAVSEVSDDSDIGFGDSAWIELEFILRLIEKSGFSGLLHVSEPLLLVRHNEHEPIGVSEVLLRHLEVRNYYDARINSQVKGMYCIEYGHDHKPLVSIIIAVCDELAPLVRCVESLLAVTVYQYYEIIIADNMSKAPETITWLESISKLGIERIRVIRTAVKSSRAQVLNAAARVAGGEYLLLLSHETSFEHADWLNVMLNHAQRPEVGVVGPRLIHPLEQLHYAGFVLGLRSVVSRPFYYKSMASRSIACRFLVDQNYSALPDICFLTKRSTFDELGGFDEREFGDFYADSDFCLKAVSAGYINVWTPHSKVNFFGCVHHESVSEICPPNIQLIHMQQRENFYGKWIDLIAADPAYNPNYSIFSEGFSIDDRKSMFATNNFTRWSPLSWRPLPVIYAQPSDRNGCGHYRIIQPFNSLKLAGLVDGFIEDSNALSIETARLKPDVLVVQRVISNEGLAELKAMKRRQNFFMVMDLDDYLPGLPQKNELKKYYADKDIMKKIKDGLSLADRFVVSTPGLADVFDGLHRDIRISELKLPVEWWSNLSSSLSIRTRPRVGWAGGVSHMGDLEMIADVVKALASEVDWVFFGMCPVSLRPWVKEVHTGVPIELYPEKLANLNLDLAISPLENNIFNDCKSNLRLLEYGACAYPVVCSDARAYRDSGLPVTIVKNRFKDWVAAIRMHINDLDEAQRCGNSLRQAVLSDWMLRGRALEQWRDNWTPD